MKREQRRVNRHKRKTEKENDEKACQKFNLGTKWEPYFYEFVSIFWKAKSETGKTLKEKAATTSSPENQSKLVDKTPNRSVKIKTKLDISSDLVERKSKLNGLISSACPTLCAFYTLSTPDPWQCYMLQFPSHNPGLSILWANLRPIAVELMAQALLSFPLLRPWPTD